MLAHYEQVALFGAHVVHMPLMSFIFGISGAVTGASPFGSLLGVEFARQFLLETPAPPQSLVFQLFVTMFPWGEETHIH